MLGALIALFALPTWVAKGRGSTADPILLRKLGGVFGACRSGANWIVATLRPASPSIAVTALSLTVALIVPLLALGAIAGAMTLHPAALLHPVAIKGVGAAVLGETASNAVVETRQKFEAKQKELSEVLTLAADGNAFDLGRKVVLEKLGAVDANDALAKIKGRNVELDGIAAELRVHELKLVQSSITDRDNERRQPSTGTQLIHPATELKAKSLGDLFTASDVYVKEYRGARRRDIPVTIDIGIKQIFSEGTPGFPPESVRTGLLVEGATRPIQVLDLIPTRPINQALDKYMAETTRTHASAEKAEAAAYAESTFVWTEKTTTIQKITDSVPVTDEQLEDAPQVSSLLNSRIIFGLRQRLDGQVINGNGTSPNLSGFTDTTHHTGIQTQAKGTDPTLDATYKALTLVRFTGRANPSAYIFNPNDWQNIRLTRTTTGEYLFGNPSQAGATTLWGLPVALADSLSAGTIITGDFPTFSYIGERRGVEVQIGYVNDDFIKGKQTIRGDLRCCLSITREAAFCLITGV
jgi:3D (Asp-Asp-Asp) domain-containing protein